MRSGKDRYETIEIKTYAAYSEVAKDLEMTIDQVSTVYDWYLKKTLEDIKELPTVKVRLSGLGVLVFNPNKAMKLIATKLKSEILCTQSPREDLTAVRGYRNYYMLKDWIQLFEDRYNRGKVKKLYVEVVTTYFDQILEKQKQHHKNLYESLQRVHGPEPDGSKEFKKDLTGSNNENSELF